MVVPCSRVISIIIVGNFESAHLIYIVLVCSSRVAVHSLESHLVQMHSVRSSRRGFIRMNVWV